MNAMLLIAMLLIAMLIGQPPQAPLPPQAPRVVDNVEPLDVAMLNAIAKKKTLVIFVRCPEQPISGAMTVRVDSMYDHPGPAVLLAVAGPNAHKFFRMLGEHPSMTEIEAQVRRRESEVSGQKGEGNDCWCSFGGICRCEGGGHKCVCNGELPPRAKAVQPSVSPFYDPFSLSNQRSSAAAAGEGRGVKAAGPQFNASHRCPSCGTTQTIISGRGPGGTHTHTCPRDGTTWYH